MENQRPVSTNALIANFEKNGKSANELSTEDEWISIDDELPKKNGYYICYYVVDRPGIRRTWRTNTLYWKDGAWFYHKDSSETIGHVTHWATLA